MKRWANNAAPIASCATVSPMTSTCAKAGSRPSSVAKRAAAPAGAGRPSAPVNSKSMVRASAWLASERTSVSSGACSLTGMRSSTSVEIFRA
ncbi:MAG: hypothetical protein PSU94_09005 [Lacunisphaera sp.]|nr:hypothetical protein [Lacunisphaera sp.]